MMQPALSRRRPRFAIALAMSCVLIALPLSGQPGAGPPPVPQSDGGYSQGEQDAREDLNTRPYFEWIAAGLFCSALGVAAALLLPTKIPDWRLTGKTPEYVRGYTDTYKKVDRNSRLFASGSMCCLGALVGGLVAYLFSL